MPSGTFWEGLFLEGDPVNESFLSDSKGTVRMGKRQRFHKGSSGPTKRVKFPVGKHKKHKETDLDFVSQHDYVMLGDFLFVRPYVFEFKTNFKPRWRNKTVFQSFCEEFTHTDPQYWEKEFKNGRIISSEKPLDKDVVWQDGLDVVHIVHRHESAVLSQKIDIIEDNDKFLVVSKPPSVPIHPCGTYRRNSLLFILCAFHGYQNLLSVHRLDKETSGLVILAKDQQYAFRFCTEIQEHKVRKTYLAEVCGTFPAQVTECAQPIHWDKRAMKASIRDGGIEARTCFKVLKVRRKSGTSIVECIPVTGRTHQIRIHLAHLGFPIVNDRLYSSEHEEQKSLNQEISKNVVTVSLNSPEFEESEATNALRHTHQVCKWTMRAKERSGRFLSALEEGEELACANCPQVVNVKNVDLKAMYIHLHAKKYESDDWSFEVPPPQWIEHGESSETDEGKEPSSKVVGPAQWTERGEPDETKEGKEPSSNVGSQGWMKCTVS